MPSRVFAAAPLILIVSVIASQSTQAGAGVVLSLAISDLVVEADQAGNATFEVEVFASADVGTQTLRGYDLFVDIGNDGVGVPHGWTVTTPVVVTEIGDFFYSSASPSAGDASASDANISGPDFELTMTPTALWRFQVDVSASAGAVDGDVDIAFMTSATNFGLSDANGLLSFSDVATSPITVTFQDFSAVPEPTAMVLFGIPLTALAVIRCRLRARRAI